MAGAEMRPEDLPAFVEEYAGLTDWTHKSHLVTLLQDSQADVLYPVMRDILHVPDCPDDECWSVRAIALSYFDGNVDRFGVYFDDHALARRRIAERTRELESR